MPRDYELVFDGAVLGKVNTGFDKAGQPVATVTLLMTSVGERIGALIDMASMGPVQVTFYPQAAYLDNRPVSLRDVVQEAEEAINRGDLDTEQMTVRASRPAGKGKES